MAAGSTSCTLYTDEHVAKRKRAIYSVTGKLEAEFSRPKVAAHVASVRSNVHRHA